MDIDGSLADEHRAIGTNHRDRDESSRQGRACLWVEDCARRDANSRHVGSGHLLADFWYRAWAECLPASGRQVRPGPCYQVHPYGLFVEDPDTFVTDIYIPVA